MTETKMPTYKVINKKTNDELSMFCSYAELQDFLKNNPTFEHGICSVAIVSGISTRLKPDKGFRELLGEIKKKNPKAKINDFGG